MELFFKYLREEKSDLEMEYEARLREMDEKHQHELQELENAYQQKIMGEVERYQVIVALCEEVSPRHHQCQNVMEVRTSQFLAFNSPDCCRPYHTLECVSLICLGACTRKKYATGSMERTAAAPRHDTRKVKLCRTTRFNFLSRHGD